MSGPKLAYRISEAAEAVGLSRSTLYELIAHKEIRQCRK